MPSSLVVFAEPDLEFRYGQRAKDPHDGLSLFGPFDADAASRPGRIAYLVAGTERGIALLEKWSEAVSVAAADAPKANYRLWPPYPGFEGAFGAQWPPTPTGSYSVRRDDILRASRHRDPHERAFRVVERYLDPLRRASQLDERVDVAICVVPDEVWENCRPRSRVVDAIGPRFQASTMRARRAGQLDFVDAFDPEQYELSPDFRRQLKARSMQYGIPLQIIRESTLRVSETVPTSRRRLTPLSDRMWNLTTAIYYKAGGKPWRLVTAREGVCYIGIAFRRTNDERTACCAAQMFLNTGDGVVFLGQFGPWYSPETHQFHLDRQSAQNLLEGVLNTYRDLGGKALTEIFLHYRSSISDDEFSGFEQACPRHVKLVGVRVRTDRFGPRMYRTTGMPVLRGSFLRLDSSSGFLWGSGFKPNLATYDGWETPVPLRIDVQHGDSAIERVAQDIFGLTKLNYNACRLGDSEPVTIAFSNSVGEILVSNPTVTSRRPNFKYYI